LKAALEKAFPDLDVQMIKGKGGAFEIRSGDTLVFSKKKTGRFPTHEEVIALLKH